MRFPTPEAYREFVEDYIEEEHLREQIRFYLLE